MFEQLRKYHIILASNSPRRKELLGGLGLDFDVCVLPDIKESYPADLPVSKIAEYIAAGKAQAYQDSMQARDLIITADTVVIVDDEVLGKPKNAADATRMLKMISGRKHQVTTGVCMMTAKKKRCFSVTTNVTFKQLTDEEISYYVDTYHPFDKAGAYGIQEWIGYVGVTSLEGSYYNVMGFPIQKIYTEMLKMLEI